MSGRNGLISTAELAEILGQADLRLFDCTTYLEPAPEGSSLPYLAVPGRHTFEAGQKYRDFRYQLYWTGIAELKGRAHVPAAFS